MQKNNVKNCNAKDNNAKSQHKKLKHYTTNKIIIKL